MAGISEKMLVISVLLLLAVQGLSGVDINSKTGVRWDDGQTSFQAVHGADNILPHVRIRRQKHTQRAVSPQMTQMTVPQDRPAWQSLNTPINDVNMRWDDGSSHSLSGREWSFWPQVNRLSQLPQTSTNQHYWFYHPYYQNMNNFDDWVKYMYPYLIQGPEIYQKPVSFGASPANVILMHFVPAMQSNVRNIAGLSSSLLPFHSGLTSHVNGIPNNAIGMMGIPSRSIIGGIQLPSLNNGNTFSHTNQFPIVEAGQMARFPVIQGNTFPPFPIRVANSNISGPTVGAGKANKPVDDK